MKIYTRTGDDGKTGLFGGHRVSKCDARVDAYGNIDELNAVLGVARSHGLPPELDEPIEQFQRDLFVLGAELATVPGAESKLGISLIDEDDVVKLEELIDRTEAHLPPLKHFVLPGGSPAGATLHLCRTVCRRAERSLIAAQSVTAIRPVLIRYINRLSDLLFVWARRANQLAGVTDKPWAPRPRAKTEAP